MAIVIVSELITSEELGAAKEDNGNYIKVVVDIEREIVAAGGEWHADAEKVLLEKGSHQDNLWGGGIDLENGLVEFTSLINMRPRYSRSQEVLDQAIRGKMEIIIRRIFGI